MQKRLNRSRCRLGYDSCGPKKAWVRRDQGRTNPFATVRGNKSAMRPIVDILWTLVIIRPNHICTQWSDACSLLLQMSHEACSVCLFACVCVCVLGIAVSCEKTAELTEMPFEGLTNVDPTNHAEQRWTVCRQWKSTVECHTYKKKGLCEEHDTVVDGVDYLWPHVLGPNTECNYHEYWTNKKPAHSTTQPYNSSGNSSRFGRMRKNDDIG